MLNPDPKGLAVIGAFILLAFLAGLAIKFYRTGVLYPWGARPRADTKAQPRSTIASALG